MRDRLLITCSTLERFAMGLHPEIWRNYHKGSACVFIRVFGFVCYDLPKSFLSVTLLLDLGVVKLDEGVV